MSANASTQRSVHGKNKRRLTSPCAKRQELKIKGKSTPIQPITMDNQKHEVHMGFRETVKRSSITDWCIAIFTLALVVVAIYQFHIMDGQLGEMKTATIQSTTQFRQDERPYIGETSKSTQGPMWHQNPIDNTRGQIEWIWHMTNYGKSPANNVSFTQEMKLAGGEWKPSYGESGPSIGQPQVQGNDTFDEVISEPMPKKEYERLLGITDGISIRIKIQYAGLDGSPYETGLCLSRTNAGSITYCKQDNYIK